MAHAVHAKSLTVPTQNCDLLQNLEILSHILGNFPLTSSDRINASKVCLAWEKACNHRVTLTLMVEKTLSVKRRDIYLWLTTYKNVLDQTISFEQMIGQFKNLRVLILSDSGKMDDKRVKKVAEIAPSSIRRLELSRTVIEKPCFKGFDSIEEIAMISCSKLNSLSFDYLRCLKNLNVSSCKSLKDDHIDQLWTLKCLETLSMNFCEGVQYPTFKHLPALKQLNMVDCSNLQIPIFKALNSLRAINLSNCKRLSNPFFDELGALEEIDLTGCEELEDILYCELGSLKTVTLINCVRIQEVYFEKIKTLESIHFSNNYSLKKIFLNSLPTFKPLTHFKTSLTFLELSDLPSVGISLKIKKLKNLQKLSLKNIPLQELVLYQLDSLKTDQLHLQGIPKLRKISVVDCNQLKSMNLSPFSSLELVILKGNSALTEVELKEMPHLKTIELTCSYALRHPHFHRLPALRSLDMRHVPSIGKLRIFKQLFPASVKLIRKF